MKKPDRFERVVAKNSWDGLDVKDTRSTRKGIWASDAADLLRKEHAWMERMVQKHLELWASPPILEEHRYGRDCRAAQCREILSSLKQRRK